MAVLSKVAAKGFCYVPVVNVDIVQTSDSEINPRYRGIYILQTLQITAREKGAFRRKCLKKGKKSI